MNPNSLSMLALAGNRDMNEWLVPTGYTLPIRKHLPESGGTDMAEHRSPPACQYRRHPSPFIADVGMADRVDTAMNAVQAAGGHAVSDGTRGEPAGSQLRR